MPPEPRVEKLDELKKHCKLEQYKTSKLLDDLTVS